MTLVPRDGDGDGFIDDGKATMRPAPPDSGAFSTRENGLIRTAASTPLSRLSDGKGPVESFLRKNLDRIGVDPYDLDYRKLRAHAISHASQNGVYRNRAGQSRFWFKSPCWANRHVDFSVHVLLPQMLRQKYPELAKSLTATSPRWKVDPKDFATLSVPVSAMDILLIKLESISCP